MTGFGISANNTVFIPQGYMGIQQDRLEQHYQQIVCRQIASDSPAVAFSIIARDSTNALFDVVADQWLENVDNETLGSVKCVVLGGTMVKNVEHVLMTYKTFLSGTDFTDTVVLLV